MDMRDDRGRVPPSEIDGQSLDFHSLYQRVQGLIHVSIYPKAGAVEKWAFRMGWAAAVIGILVGQLAGEWITATAALKTIKVCLAVELIGFIVGGLLAAGRGIRQFSQPRLSHAQEMDCEYAHWEAVIRELRSFPRVERERRLQYVSTLRTNMIDRLGLMYGGLQRLGPLPLLIALFVQLREWEWGDWAGAFDVSPVAKWVPTPMNRVIFFYVLLAAAVLGVSGCQESAALKATTEATVAPANGPARSAVLPITDVKGLFDKAADSRAMSWDAFVSGVSRSERAYLEGVSKRYFEALKFETAEGRSELIRQGTPLPEEWLAAQDVSDADLRTMADKNDQKAGIFLVDRLLTRMATITKQAGASTYLEVVNALPEAERPAIDKDRREAMDRSASQFAANPTPFTAYQFGLGFSVGTGSTAGIPAAMTVAGELGDPRAAKLLADYSAMHPDENPKLVATVTSAMRALAGPSEK